MPPACVVLDRLWFAQSRHPPAARLLSDHYPPACHPSDVPVYPTAGCGWGLHRKHPGTQSYPHGGAWLSHHCLTPSKKPLSSAPSQHFSDTSKHSQLLLSLSVVFSLWILNHLVDYITNYSFLSLSSMLSILVSSVIQLCISHCNQFIETVLV